MSTDLEILAVAQRLRDGDLSEGERKEMAALLKKAVAQIRESARRLAAPVSGKT